MSYQTRSASSLLVSLMAVVALCSAGQSVIADPDTGGVQVTDLGTLGGDASGAAAIDGQGTVTGWSNTGTGSRRAFSICNGCVIVDMGTLPNGGHSFGSGISTNGAWFVGSSGIQPSGYPPGFFPDIRQGFVQQMGTMGSVGALFNPGDFNHRFGTSEAHGVNDLGQVVGFSNVRRANYYHAFVWQGDVMQDLSTTGAGDPSYSRAFDINNAGQIVGDLVDDANFNFDASAPKQAVLWEAGSYRYLGNLPGHDSSSATKINEHGVVAGWSGDSVTGISTAVLWSAGVVRALGTLENASSRSSRALGLNNLQQVVGWEETASGESHAFFWQDGLMLDLNSVLPPRSNWVLLEASGINDQGMIAGTGLHDGNMRAYLLKAPGQSREYFHARALRARGHD